MKRTVIAWRHGRTEWNLAGRVQGQSDIPLDDVGRQQARDAAARLASLNPGRIISSDLSRAAETAQSLASLTGLDLVLDPRFRELNFGEREGLTWREAWKQFPDAMAAWVAGDETKIPGSETHQQAGERFADGLRDVLSDRVDGETLVIVAHGAVIRTGLCAFLGFPREHWSTFGGLSNCHWSMIEETWSSDWSQWRMTEWNTGTLPEPVLSDDDTVSPVEELT